MTCRLFGNKSLSEPLLAYCKLGPKEQIWEKFLVKIQTFSKYVPKCYLQYGSHFIYPQTVWYWHHWQSFTWYFLGSKHWHSKEIFQLHYIPIVINVIIIEKSSDWQWKQIPKYVFQVIFQKLTCVCLFEFLAVSLFVNIVYSNRWESIGPENLPYPFLHTIYTRLPEYVSGLGAAGWSV